MTKIESISKIFAPQLKELGLITKSTKRIWLDDNGFFVTIVEFQPLYSEGFIINMGVKFMWDLPGCISYDYTYDYGRILIPHSPIQDVLFYNAPTFETDIEYMKGELNKNIEIYRQLKDKKVLFDSLRNRKSRVDDRFPDTDLGVAAMLVGEKKLALNIFNESAEQLEFARECLNNCQSTDVFESFLLTRVNSVRSEFSSINHYKLPSITNL